MSDYPARNRRATALPAGSIEIEDRGGAVKRLEGEAVLVAMAGEYSGHKPLAVGEPGFESLLCGEQGYLLRTEDVEVPLTLREIVHLLLNALAPEQYLKLRETYGLFGPIGEDYYDPQTAKAKQPKVRLAKG